MSRGEGRLAEAGARVKHKVDSRLGHLWWAILLRGLLAIALAVCAFAWPERTIDILVKLLGAYFLIDGVIAGVGCLRSGQMGSALMQAIVSLALGLVLLLWSGVSAKVFLILLGVWLVLQGLGVFLSSLKVDPNEGDRLMMGIVGAVMAVIGLVFIFWTDTGVTTVSWLIGIGAFIIGALLIFLATRVRRLRRRVDRIGEGG